MGLYLTGSNLPPFLQCCIQGQRGIQTTHSEKYHAVRRNYKLYLIFKLYFEYSTSMEHSVHLIALSTVWYKYSHHSYSSWAEDKISSTEAKLAVKANRHGATLPRNLGVQRLPCNLCTSWLDIA